MTASVPRTFLTRSLTMREAIIDGRAKKATMKRSPS